MGTHRTSDTNFFLLPADTDSERQLFFIFSKVQVIEIIKDINRFPVPFCPGFIKGVAPYNQQLIPIVCLEEMLGLENSRPGQVYRQFIVVRSSEVNPETGDNLQVIIAAHSKLQFPKGEAAGGIDAFKKKDIPEHLDNVDFIRGFFMNTKEAAVVVDFNQLLLSGLLPAAYSLQSF